MRRLFWLAALVSIVSASRATLAGDQETAEEIKASLGNSLKNYSVNIKVQDGTAWLEGFVANGRQMAAAVDIAGRTAGVERVVNNLAIGGAAPAARGGAANLRQPGGVAVASWGQPGPVASAAPQRGGRVVQASMELPDHAQQELMQAGPMPEMNSEMPQGNAGYMSGGAGGGNYPQAPPGYFPNNGYQQSIAMRNANRPMPVANMPRPVGSANYPPMQPVSQSGGEFIGAPQPIPAGGPMGPGAPAPYRYDSPQMPGYAWPSYAAHPNYAAVTYPKQYSPTAWPYIGPFYPYPQVPLGWRKVTLEWDDGWWFLDFKDSH